MAIQFKITRYNAQDERADIEIEAWIDEDGELDYIAPEGLTLTEDEHTDMVYAVQADHDLGRGEEPDDE